MLQTFHSKSENVLRSDVCVSVLLTYELVQNQYCIVRVDSSTNYE